jgi:SAM-dependent methyltransferase
VSIHEAALQGFGRGAPAYERGRPSYPQAAVDWMLERLEIGPGRVVADLGAGTGKFTRLLVASGARVLAVEPVAGMRAELRQAVPAAEVLDATAQAIPVKDGSLDAVTAAQAFHWFAGDRVLTEIHRALRADGGLGLIWNRRDLKDPVQVALDGIIARHRGAAPTHEGDRWMDTMDQTSLFTPIGTQQFGYEQVLDRAGLADRVLSISFIAALGESQREAVAAEVEAVAGAETHFRLSYRTDVYLFRRA